MAIFQLADHNHKILYRTTTRGVVPSTVAARMPTCNFEFCLALQLQVSNIRIVLIGCNHSLNAVIERKLIRAMRNELLIGMR